MVLYRNLDELATNNNRRFRNCLSLVCGVVLLNLCAIYLYRNSTGFTYDYKLNVLDGTTRTTAEQQNGTNKHTEMAEPRPLILGWNHFHEKGPLMQNLIQGTKIGDYYKGNSVSDCAYECEYTDDKTRLPNASMVVFHVRNPMTPLPAQRRPEQLFTFFLLETPIHTKDYINAVPRDYFNITMTYRIDSDVFYPYDEFQSLEKGDSSSDQMWTQKEVLEKVANKSKLAVQIVSNCWTNAGRHLLLDELKAQHMDFSVLGACNKTACDAKCFQQQIDSHFFYLAFENSVCMDYVSEKFWNVKRLIVPVVLSRKAMANLNVPSNSFIAADDFASAKQLAEHLQMLANNPRLYLRHFEWTKHYKRTHRGDSAQNPLCRLCEFSAKGERKTIPDIFRYWRDGGKCESGFVKNVLFPKWGRKS